MISLCALTLFFFSFFFLPFNHVLMTEQISELTFAMRHNNMWLLYSSFHPKCLAHCKSDPAAAYHWTLHSLCERCLGEPGAKTPRSAVPPLLTGSGPRAVQHKPVNSHILQISPPYQSCMASINATASPWLKCHSRSCLCHIYSYHLQPCCFYYFLPALNAC